MSAYADSLARDVIEQGIRNDLRREAAQEELAALCGSYAAVDEIKFDKYGNIDKPEEGTPLRTCLDEEKHPIVFLTNVPEDKRTDPEYVRDVLGCDGAGSTNPLCGETVNYKENAALELTAWADPNAPADPACDIAASAVDTMPSGFQGNALADLVAETWFNMDSIQNAGRLVSVEQELDGSWRVRSGGVVLMSSHPFDGAFPGCLRNGQCRPEYSESVIVFSKAFRSPGSVGAVLNLGETCPQWNAEWLPIQRADGVSQCIKALGANADLGGPDADIESKMILWRVQGAAWLLGSMAGEIRAGAFTAPFFSVGGAEMM